MRSAIVYTVLLLSFSYSQAQVVQVSEEPRHHVAFRSDRVRVLDVHIPAGDTSLWHKHSTPSVFIILSNTKTGSEVRIEPAKQAFTDGRIWFEGFYDTPRIHRVWNADDHEFHVIDMELPSKTHKRIDSALTGKDIHLLFDEEPVRGYRMELEPQMELAIGRRKAAVVIVCISEAEDVRVNNTVLHKKGDYVFVPAGTKLNLIHPGEEMAAVALMELK